MLLNGNVGLGNRYSIVLIQVNGGQKRPIGINYLVGVQIKTKY
jgi:hypothetical protein